MANRVNNSLAPQDSRLGGQPRGFSAIINSDSSRRMIDKSIGDPQRSAAFVSTLISAVNSNPRLKSCDPGSIISSALRGEIGMNLSYAMGEYAIVPYGNTATFQIQVGGIKRLAIRSNAYSDIGFYEVREGEYRGRDRKTRNPIIEWEEDEDKRDALPIVGYYGYYALNEAYNNFFQCIYWTKERVLRHADKYSKAFKREKYNAMMEGNLSADEVKKLLDGSPWYDDDGTASCPFQKMALKTICKQLLGDGLAPKEIIQAINADNAQERSETPVIYSDDLSLNAVIDASAEDVTPNTAEIPSNFAQEGVSDREPTTASKKTTKRATEENKPVVDESDGFFD